MDNSLQDVLSNLQISAFFHENIRTVKTKNSKEGIDVANKILQEVVDRQTVLFLSGGSTPKPLYEKMAREKTVAPSVAAMIDERYVEPPPTGGADNSNEKMLKGTGLLSYFEKTNIPFYGILNRHPQLDWGSRFLLDSRLHGNDRQQLAQEYDETVRYLLHNFPKSVGILGVGNDGHTAGIPADLPRLNLGTRFNLNEFVVDYDDQERFYKERITMTFLALSMLDVLIVLVFGKEKKKALAKMFTPGSEEEIPARFFTRPEIAKKTLLITDIKV